MTRPPASKRWCPAPWVARGSGEIPLPRSTGSIASARDACAVTAPRSAGHVSAVGPTAVSACTRAFVVARTRDARPRPPRRRSPRPATRRWSTACATGPVEGVGQDLQHQADRAPPPETTTAAARDRARRPWPGVPLHRERDALQHRPVQVRGIVPGVEADEGAPAPRLVGRGQPVEHGEQTVRPDRHQARRVVELLLGLTDEVADPGHRPHAAADPGALVQVFPRPRREVSPVAVVLRSGDEEPMVIAAM